ncbi:uncharacterized protein Nmag_1837A [Natrialba magadii ATCC 43099]|uniref:Uncharacterized protein n=1 Tax=Natrialba magadii (strain ATCC 43099 / DSM 3394 / CCM 3739 / CIP 104546 / IAM 13178 / JCM 8861 / NBRC 102185 / NCIMB 2190 / MS3) TaxID=547559 RepID=A0A1C9J6Y8_NATMM|nr:hypothetical protein [Natrialba magadii]AOP12861.1 uncharacterized protein Nmag_1837A [Natrialba magadii ATCC 43099]
MDVRRSTSLIGLGTIAFGAYLPWVTTHPNVNIEILAHPAGLGSGLEIWGAITLPISIIAVIGILADLPWVGTQKYLLLVGLVSIILGIIPILTDPGITGVFISGPGPFVTVIGSVITIISQLPPISDLNHYRTSYFSIQ